jgi:hypothetical protein
MQKSYKPHNRRGLSPPINDSHADCEGTLTVSGLGLLILEAAARRSSVSTVWKGSRPNL